MTNTTKTIIFSLVAMLLAVFSSSCSKRENSVSPSTFPPDGFSRTDLVGTWQENGVANSDETIIVSADNKFRQIFSSPDISYHEEVEGSWDLKNDGNGCVYVLFYGMRYFYQEPELIANGNRWTTGMRKGKQEKYWDECSESLVEMPDMVIMFVSQHPDYPRKIILRDMSTQRDVEDIFFALTSVTK
jgi:hypothetical protein